MEQAFGIGLGWMEEDKTIEELFEEFEGGESNQKKYAPQDNLFFLFVITLICKH